MFSKKTVRIICLVTAGIMLVSVGIGVVAMLASM